MHVAVDFEHLIVKAGDEAPERQALMRRKLLENVPIDGLQPD